MSLTLRVQKPTSNRAPRRFHLTAEQRETEEQYRYYRRAPTIKFDHQQQSSTKQSSTKQSSAKQSSTKQSSATQTKNSFATLSGSSEMPERHEEFPCLGTKTKKSALHGAWAKKSTIKEVPATIAEPPKIPEKKKKSSKTGLAAALNAAELLVNEIEDWELE